MDRNDNQNVDFMLGFKQLLRLMMIHGIFELRLREGYLID